MTERPEEGHGSAVACALPGVIAPRKYLRGPQPQIGAEEAGVALFDGKGSAGSVG